MQLTAAHLRYLLAIYEVSRTHLDISSRSIAEKLGVTKPSVVRIMNLLMERGMIVKEHYGKIYMTDRGIFVAKEVRAQLERVVPEIFRTPWGSWALGALTFGLHFVTGSIGENAWALGAAVCWGILPLLIQLIVAIK